METLTQDQFSVLLKKFNDLVKNTPPIDKVRPKLAEIKKETLLATELTERQQAAIIDRCNNYLNGDYAGQKEISKIETENLERAQKAKAGK